jgi:hypothetical protein
MAMIFISAVVAGSAIAAALFGGWIPSDALASEALSVGLAGAASLAVASAVALDS